MIAYLRRFFGAPAAEPAVMHGPARLSIGFNRGCVVVRLVPEGGRFESTSRLTTAMARALAFQIWAAARQADGGDVH